MVGDDGVHREFKLRVTLTDFSAHVYMSTCDRGVRPTEGSVARRVEAVRDCLRVGILKTHHKQLLEVGWCHDTWDTL